MGRFSSNEGNSKMSGGWWRKWDQNKLLLFFEDERSNTCMYAIGTSIEGENLGKQKIAGRLLVNKPSTHVEEWNLDKNTGSSVKAKLMGQCWWVEDMKRESDGDSFLMASVFSVTENEDSWLGVMKKEVWEVRRKEAGRVLKGAAEGIPPAYFLVGSTGTWLLVFHQPHSNALL